MHAGCVHDDGIRRESHADIGRIQIKTAAKHGRTRDAREYVGAGAQVGGVVHAVEGVLVRGVCEIVEGECGRAV